MLSVQDRQHFSWLTAIKPRTRLHTSRGRRWDKDQYHSDHTAPQRHTAFPEVVIGFEDSLMDHRALLTWNIVILSSPRGMLKVWLKVNTLSDLPLASQRWALGAEKRCYIFWKPPEAEFCNFQRLLWRSPIKRSSRFLPPNGLFHAWHPLSPFEVPLWRIWHFDWGWVVLIRGGEYFLQFCECLLYQSWLMQYLYLHTSINESKFIFDPFRHIFRGNLRALDWKIWSIEFDSLRSGQVRPAVLYSHHPIFERLCSDYSHRLVAWVHIQEASVAGIGNVSKQNKESKM